jgi:BMFP domain-containing protein YqiC
MNIKKVLIPSVIGILVFTSSAFAHQISPKNNQSIEKEKSEFSKRENPFESLVTQGIITDEELETLKEALETGRNEEKTFEEVLDELVTESIITSDQKIAITDTLPSPKENVHKHKKGNPLDMFINEGILTDEEFETLREALVAGRDEGKTFEETLGELESESVITSEQKTTILNTIPEKRNIKHKEKCSKESLETI